MPDILKSAQSQINDAAQQANISATVLPPTEPIPPQPKETALLPQVTTTDDVSNTLDLPFSLRGSNDHADEHKNTLPLEPDPESTIPPHIDKKRRGSNKSLIVAVLLFLLATLPLAVTFTSQQRQLADLRGRAQEGPYADNIEYYGCIKDGGTPEECSKGKNLSLPSGYRCTSGESCDSGVCYSGQCVPNDNTEYYGCIKDGTDPEVCKQGKNLRLPNDYKCTSGTTCASGYCSPTGKCDTKPTTTAGTTTSTGGTPITTLAPGTSQCQNGDQNRDQGSWLICECANGCSYKTDTTEGSGGSGWVCDQNCHTVPAGTRPSGACTQIDWVHSGSSNYCGVAEINCPASCQTGGSTTTTTGGTTTTTTTSENPTATPTPTTVPGGTCELIKVYDAAGTEITQAVRDGTKKLALGEEVTIATSKGNATKARFRIQGIADWTENDPSKTTTTEYRLSITIPSTMTQAQGTFEVEVYVNGVWK